MTERSRVNGSTSNSINVRLLQQRQFGGERSQQLGCSIRTQNAQWMRIEGHDNGLAAKGASALGHMAHDLLMRAMHAIEVAHTDYGRPKLAGTSSRLRKICISIGSCSTQTVKPRSMTE